MGKKNVKLTEEEKEKIYTFYLKTGMSLRKMEKHFKSEGFVVDYTTISGVITEMLGRQKK